ncbi:hypothetical protein E2C01_057520 [Portunus trituberculatus]|uniref:Uncharacterized protein n=1 Tax=Portunus trituberculatus TaxID=210409 RepID=A0A5B7GX13_PORTR|nr:hypothetical protein [Portunus trituberculatus]
MILECLLIHVSLSSISDTRSCLSIFSILFTILYIIFHFLHSFFIGKVFFFFISL